MTTAMAIVKYFIDFGNKRFLLLLPSPPIKEIAFFKSFFISILTFPSVETMYLLALNHETNA